MSSTCESKSKIVVTVIGARPQFVKAAAVSNSFKNQKHINEIIIHTGQHYDEKMSEIFFRELGIPTPYKNLNIGGGTHGQMTGRQIEALEREFYTLNPDLVLVYGDTNSTLAAAIAASKMDVPIAHVEAGLRSGNLSMPEEINRKLTDHASTLLFSTSNKSSELLYQEGFCKEKVIMVGDVMKDICQQFSELATRPEIVSEDQSNFILATIHRAETLQNIDHIKNIFSAFSQFQQPIILPAHPNTFRYLTDNKIDVPGNVFVITPVSYLEMLWLLKRSLMVCTDSGGLQKEAYFMGKPCITLRNETEWDELIECGWNILAGYDVERILHAYNSNFEMQEVSLYGDGNAANKITHRISEFLV